MESACLFGLWIVVEKGDSSLLQTLGWLSGHTLFCFIVREILGTAPSVSDMRLQLYKQTKELAITFVLLQR